MTASELIAKLQELPPDVVVRVHKNCGCCDWMPEADTVTFIRAGEKDDAFNEQGADFVQVINENY